MRRFVTFGVFAIIAGALAIAMAQTGDPELNEKLREDRVIGQAMRDSQPPQFSESGGKGYELIDVPTFKPGDMPQDRDHTWTDKNGRKLTGDLVSIDIVIRVKTEKGSPVTLSWSKLSPNDQKAVRSRVRRLALPSEAIPEKRRIK